MGLPAAPRAGLATVVAAAGAVAFLLAVASPSTAVTATGPTPTPRFVKYIDAADTACITKWTVTGKNASMAGGWEWTSKSACCPPQPMTKTMITYDKGRKCRSVWAPCDRYMTTSGKCAWKLCDRKTCEEPVCPPAPPTMKTRWAKKDGTRCVKTWKACGTHFFKGVCTWKGCDIIKCKPPCVKPMGKNMKLVVSPTKTCTEAWWPVSVVIDHSTDGQVCTWKWKDAKTCYCKQINGSFKKC